MNLKDERGADYFLGYAGHLSIDGRSTIRVDGLPAGSWTVAVESIGGTAWTEPVTTWTGQPRSLKRLVW